MGTLGSMLSEGCGGHSGLRCRKFSTLIDSKLSGYLGRRVEVEGPQPAYCLEGQGDLVSRLIGPITHIGYPQYSPTY